MTVTVAAASQTTADRIHAIADAVDSRQVTLGTVVDMLGTSGTGFCILLLGLTTLVPGIAPLFGLALCTVSFGLLLGHCRPYLPLGIRRLPVDGGRLRRGLRRLAPSIAWTERWLRPRFLALLGGAGSRLAGLAGMVNGALIVLPIPFGNTAPAIAVLVLALGLVIGDGLAVGAALGLTVVAIIIDVGLVVFGFAALTSLFDGIF